MCTLFQLIMDSNSIIIAGHINPDGDCIGACLALGNYIKNNYKEKSVNVLLEKIPEMYNFLNGKEIIITKPEIDKCDLFISLDCGDEGRLGEFYNVFQMASKTINIDHHISNTKFADYNDVRIVSSTCEIIYDLLKDKEITKDISEALYTGIIYDTGVFKHSSTTKKTMEIAGKLIEYNIDFSMIINKLFFEKSFLQNKLLGKVLLNSEIALNNLCVYSYITYKEVILMGINSNDSEGIIDNLRATKGALCAFFLYEFEQNKFKVNLRSNDIIDVCKIARYYNGGGHVKASGCIIEGELNEVIKDLINKVREQIG